MVANLVPEPEIYAMLVPGFGLIGFIAKRKKPAGAGFCFGRLAVLVSDRKSAEAASVRCDLREDGR